MNKTISTIGICLIFNALDFASGFVAAVRNHNIESCRLRDGLFKKVGFLFCYVLAWIMDRYGGAIGLNLPVSITPVIALYVCTTEIVSIIENICQINPDLLPAKLIKLFKVSMKEEEI